VTATRLAGTGAAAAAAAAALGALAAVTAARASPWALAAPVVVCAVVPLLLYPKVLLAATLVAVTVLESDEEGFLAGTHVVYLGLLDVGVRMHELLLLLCAAGVALRLARERRALRLPGPFALPLLLLTAAIAIGLTTGWFAGGDRTLMLNSVRELALLIVVPFLAVNLLDDRRDVERALAIVVAVVAVKVAVGAAGWLLGQGREVAGTVLTYYEPLPNLVLMLFALAAFAAVLGRLDVPLVVRLLGLAALAVLVLSFRRNFWIAAVVAGVIVLLVVTGAHGRWLLLPAALAFAIGLWVGVTALSASQSQSPIIQRAQSLAPGRLSTQAGDRYRIDEQRNVRAEIARHPFLGIGLGVPWTARHPIPVTFPGGQNYTHTLALWYWLKLGLLGLLAYVWLTVAAVVTAFGLWRSGADDRIRAAGLALAAGFVGLAVAETTGSFTGVETRLTMFVGATLGWLAAARALAVRR
jgi:O-antigen ligase